ncbi:MAG TPA: helix-turn-helix domain-containing protein [Planktothrix sp.]
MFGPFIKERRLKRRLSLRSFSERLDFDPSQWSKIERGILAPPKAEKTLARIATVLEIPPDSDEWAELKDLAALSAGRIPDDLLTDAELVKCLPLVFRTVRNTKPTEKELRNLAEIVRRNVRR